MTAQTAASKAQTAASKEYARRRRHLMELMGPGGIAVLPAAPTRRRSRDTHHEYRQDSDFFYLTGFGEPESVAVLVPGRPEGEFILFCRDRDPQRELWDGPRAGPEGAAADHAADDAFPIDDIDEILPGLLERSERVYYAMGASDPFDGRLMGWMHRLRGNRQRGGGAPDELVSLEHLLHEMRLFKSRAEIRLMRRSARLAVAAHRRAMRVCKPGMREYELEAEFRHEFARHGARCSYTPIVAAGANACVLHYTDNRAPLADGDLVLIDAGCEYGMYASDVTRTFPVNGRFSGPQRELYDIVHSAHAAAVGQARPGNHWNDPHAAAAREITRGLKELGLLKGRLGDLVKKEAYKPYFMHRTGHWLGLDVHDVGDYKVARQWRLLEPGMVMTVEPGIYVAPAAGKAAARWRGIGIRLEDDVHLGRDGPRILSRDLPSSAAEIEAFMGRVR